MSLDFLEQNSPHIQNLDNKRCPTKFCRPLCRWGPSILLDIKCHPPPQPAACHCCHNSPPLPGHHHHFLHCRCCPSPPQLLPVRFCLFPFASSTVCLDFKVRVQKGLVIASRQQRRGGGGASSPASQSATIALPRTSIDDNDR
jgi:hypothetical protein